MANWRYLLDKDFYHHSPALKGVNFENKWLHIRNEVLIIRSGYAWDGCTPSINLFPGRILPKGLWIGIWDGPLGNDCRPVSWKATLLHDALCQFRKELSGLSKDVTVYLFKDLLRRNAAPAWMVKYYPAAVNFFGPQYWK